jgi:hypothetical protein
MNLSYEQWRSMTFFKSVGQIPRWSWKFWQSIKTSYFTFHDAELHHNMAHMYNKCYTIKIVRNVMQRSTLNDNTKATVNIPRLANMRAWNAMQSLLPSSLYYSMSLLIAPVQTDGECKPQLAGWLKLANNAFYLISYAVFQCMKYHWTMKVRLFIFCFSKC